MNNDQYYSPGALIVLLVEDKPTHTHSLSPIIEAFLVLHSAIRVLEFRVQFRVWAWGFRV